jgi:hypothetical protein
MQYLFYPFFIAFLHWLYEPLIPMSLIDGMLSFLWFCRYRQRPHVVDIWVT